MQRLLVLGFLNLASSNSIPPKAGEDVSISSARSCVVRLVRRTSKSTACWPDGDPRRGGYFGCKDNNTVFVSGFCAGLFQCGEGATVVCGPTSRQHNYNECTCRTPCHQNVYTIQESAKKGAPCPPAMPMPLLPPLPPTPPAVPLPVDSTSAPLHKGAHETHDHTSHAHGGHGQHGAAPTDGHAVAAAAADPVNGR